MQVSIRAFFPVWVFLYVVQFLLMPVIARDNWISLFFGNALYLVAFGYYFVITFLGYNGRCFFADGAHFTSLMQTQPCLFYTIQSSFYHR